MIQKPYKSTQAQRFAHPESQRNLTGSLKLP